MTQINEEVRTNAKKKQLVAGMIHQKKECQKPTGAVNSISNVSISGRKETDINKNQSWQWIKGA